MADFSQTVTNTMNVLGVSPGQLWGTFLWNTNWGNDEDVWTDTNKGIANTLTLTQALSKNPGKTFAHTITISGGLVSVTRSLGIWDYVFTRPTIDGEEQILDASTKVADGSTTWSAVSDGSTDWTDA